MSSAREGGRTSKYEAKCASDLRSYLIEHLAGDREALTPSHGFFSALELFIPDLLRSRFPEWERESLDGFFLARQCVRPQDTIEMAGICILITDQTVTPCLITLTLDPSESKFNSYDIRIGERGVGPLGISGPSCTSQSARLLLRSIVPRLEQIEWVYRLTSDEI